MARKRKGKNYEQIARPYGAHLEREPDLAVTLGDEEAVVGAGGGENTSYDESQGGGASTTTVKDGSSMTDLWITNSIKSKNWKPKVRGFYIDGRTGYAEFSNVYLSGGLTIDTSSSVKGGQTDYDTGTGFFLGYSSGAYKFSVGVGGTGPSLTWDGTTITVTGGVLTAPGAGTDLSLLDYTHDITFSTVDEDTVAWSAGDIEFSNGDSYTISSSNTGNISAIKYIYFDKDFPTVLKMSDTPSGAAGLNRVMIGVAQNGTGEPKFQVFGGEGGLKLGSSQVNISNNNWNFTGTFSASDDDTVAWTSGTLKVSSGNTYSIGAGTTLNMSAKTYIYFNLGGDDTEFVVTSTASNSVGDGRILIAVAEDGADEATFMMMNDHQMNITTSNIAAGAITANEISAGTITASKMNVTQLHSIAADLGTISAGTITLNSSGHIKSGQTAYNTGTGFWLGRDGGVAKFSIGDPSSRHLTWDGSDLNINGYSSTNIGTFGGDGSDGALSISSGTATLDASGARVLVKNYTSVSITGTASLTISNPHANGTILILKSQGAVIATSSGTGIDLAGMGGEGGIGGATETSAGSNGTLGTSLTREETRPYGGGSARSDRTSNNDDGGPGRAGVQYAHNYTLLEHNFYGNYRIIACGAGGGGGSASATGASQWGKGGDGGYGGGGLIIECGGSLSWSTTIDVSGLSGEDAPDKSGTGHVTSGGGGGGGSCGMGVIFANTIILNTGTFVAVGGDGGDGGDAQVTASNSCGGVHYNAGGGGGGAGSHEGDGGYGGGDNGDDTANPDLSYNTSYAPQAGQGVGTGGGGGRGKQHCTSVGTTTGESGAADGGDAESVVCLVAENKFFA